MRYLLIVFCFLISLAGFAQNAKIDSLKKVIQTTKVDTVKGRSLCRLCLELSRIGNLDAGLKKAEEGLKVSEKEIDYKGIGYCLHQIGNIHSDKGEYPQALDQYHKSISINQKINNQIAVSNTLFNIANIYSNQGAYPQALTNYQKSQKIYEQLNDLMGVADCLNGIGTIFLNLGTYAQALNNFQKSLRINEKIGYKEGISYCLNNIGLVYRYQDDFAQALNNFQKSLKIEEQLDDKAGVAISMDNIGIIYRFLGDHAQALNHFQKSLKLNEQLNNQIGVSACLVNIGNINREQGNLTQALSNFQESLKINEQFRDSNQLSLSNSNIAFTYIKLGQPHLAKIFARKGLQIAQNNKHIGNMQTGACASFQVDSAMGDWKSAFEYHKLYKQYSDSLHNEDKAKEFGRVESKYQFEKEAEETKRKEAELAKIEAEKNQRRDNLQFLTIFAGIIGLFAGLVFIGKFRIPTRVMDIAVFAGLLILFEFLLILFDPIFDQYSGGIPFYKLGFNTVVAFAFAPLHGFLEDKLKRRLVKAEKM